jgi:endonuclease/exonuclease/phosphatase family metal-dependent hydrolase
LCFALASCGDHKEAIETVDNTEAIETTAESENVVIASAGTPVYTLIRYIDAYQEEVDLIVAFKNKLIADFGPNFQISADWTMPSSAPPADACEIIIGLTCREESIKTIDEFNLAYGDCAVQICDNNKIVMVAPNYNDLDKCFDYFLNNLSFNENNELIYNGGNYLYMAEDTNIFEKGFDHSELQIVYDSEGKFKKHADNISKYIKKNFEITVKAVPETEPKADHEIIVGILNDKERFKYNYSSLSGMDSIIATSESSILVCGSSDAGLSKAVESFVNLFIRSGHISTMNLPQQTVMTFNTFTGGENPALINGADTRIMSFNILSEEWDAAAVMEGRDIRVSAVILNYLPDVAALQEVSNKWYPILETNVGGIYKFTRTKNLHREGTYTTLMYNTQTTKLIEEGLEYYSVGNSKRLRSMVWGVFESIATGERYVVISTHWDVGAERQWMRMIEASEMAAFCKSLRDKYNADVFACGDYNATESTEEYKKFIQESGYVDAKNSAQVINRACKTYHTLFSNLNTSIYESIDHITFSKETKSKVLYYNTLIADYVIDASDHNPIYIDIKLAK